MRSSDHLIAYRYHNVWNSEIAAALFVVLDVMGSYSFAPDFAWPSGAGNVNGIWFYGALTNSEVTQLIGNLGSWQFGWTND